MKVEEIPIKDIIIPENRVRATFTDEQYQELKASIEKHGFNIPILVKDLGNGKYELIDGEHRIKVVKELGWDKIPAVIVEADSLKATMLNILANTARGTQNPMDVAEALKRAYDAGASVEELAAATGHTKDWVKLYLTLTELPDVYKNALRKGILKVGHIREAMRLPTPDEIAAALDTAINLHWDVKIMKYYVDRRLEELYRLQQKGESLENIEPPTPEEAERMVQYADCLFCGQKWPRKELYMPVMCPDCRSLLEYVIDQLGEPKKAMQTIYEAVKFYQEHKLKEKREAMVKERVEQEKKEEVKPKEKIGELKILEELGLKKEDLELLVKIKKLKEIGLL